MASLPDNNATPDEVVIQSAVATLMGDLPRPVQKFLSGPERDRVVLSLSQKYNLHADEAGEFEHAFIFMLLGISSPEEFVQTLTDAKLPKETITGLASDVNTQVFIPLRDAERKETQDPNAAPKDLAEPAAMHMIPSAPRQAAPSPNTATPASTTAPSGMPAAPAAQRAQTNLPAIQQPDPLPVTMSDQPLSYAIPHPSASISAPAAQNVHIYVGAQNQPQAPQPMQMAQPIFVPVSMPIQMHPSYPQQGVQAMPMSMPMLSPTQDIHPSMRTMASDMQLVKDMREGKVPPMPQPEPVRQTYQYQPPVQQTYVPPQPIVAPIPPRPIVAPSIPTAADRASGDPYREPV